MKKIFIVSLGFVFLSLHAFAQNKWQAPQEADEIVSIKMFDEDFETEGQMIYESSCKSCHGNPSQADFSLMIPSPGDIASESFQNQTDGSLFYKIKEGKGAMPKFEDALEQDEIWFLVAYIRSFNKDYVQPKPNIEGIEIPHISLELAYDENVDKLVVKTLNENGDAQLGVEVKAFVKGTFGNFMLGKKECNELGIAYFDVDAKLPGDENGNLNVIVKANKGYGSAKKAESLQMVEPVKHSSVIEGRHLWSVAKKAPYWLIITFLFTTVGIWGAIIYIIVGLLKLNKYS